MENRDTQRVEHYLGSNYESISFIRPAADMLVNARGEECNVEAVKFSACNSLPTYRIFGMPGGVFVRLEEIFGNTIETQQHTIDTLEAVKLNKNVSKEVNIQDDTLYYPVGSYVHLGFNLSLPNDEVLYVKEVIINHTGVSYVLLDAMGNEMKDIPSGLIKLKQNELNGAKLVVWERKPTMIYRVDNERVSEVDAMPAEVAEAFKGLEGKTPEEALAIMGSMSNQDLDAMAMHAGAIDADVVCEAEVVECETAINPDFAVDKKED